jgi:hypothetical protein
MKRSGARVWNPWVFRAGGAATVEDAAFDFPSEPNMGTLTRGVSVSSATAQHGDLAVRGTRTFVLYRVGSASFLGFPLVAGPAPDVGALFPPMGGMAPEMHRAAMANSIKFLLTEVAVPPVMSDAPHGHYDRVPNVQGIWRDELLCRAIEAPPEPDEMWFERQGEWVRAPRPMMVASDTWTALFESRRDWHRKMCWLVGLAFDNMLPQEIVARICDFCVTNRP